MSINQDKRIPEMTKQVVWTRGKGYYGFGAGFIWRNQEKLCVLLTERKKKHTKICVQNVFVMQTIKIDTWCINCHDWGSHLVKFDSFCLTGFWEMAGRQTDRQTSWLHFNLIKKHISYEGRERSPGACFPKLFEKWYNLFSLVHFWGPKFST